jgi:hypothetical protein
MTTSIEVSDAPRRTGAELPFAQDKPPYPSPFASS